MSDAAFAFRQHFKAPLRVPHIHTPSAHFPELSILIVRRRETRLSCILYRAPFCFGPCGHVADTYVVAQAAQMPNLGV